ncbi:MAG: hypothetical protein ACKPKO_00415, partial [Candidatus Fonsibacter sp.]
MEEKKKALETAKSHWGENITQVWITLDNFIKELDAEIKKDGGSPAKASAGNAYMKSLKQLRIAKEQRDWEQKEVERLQKEIDDNKLRFDQLETVVEDAQTAVVLAQEAVQKETQQKKGPRHASVTPEPTVLAASAEEVIVGVCAKLQAGLFGFCESLDAEYA